MCQWCQRLRCRPKLPYALSFLTTFELLLFIAVLSAAVAVNAWFLANNIARMQFAYAHPIAQTEQRTIDPFPEFALVFVSLDAPNFVSCFEGQQLGLFPPFPWIKRQRCHVVHSVVPVGKNWTTYVDVVRPTVRFGAVRNFSTININYNFSANGRGPCFSIYAMQPHLVDMYMFDMYSLPPQSSISVCPKDTGGRYIGVEASATQFLNGTHAFDFHIFVSDLSTRRADFGLWFTDGNVYRPIAWTTEFAAYRFDDVVTSSAATISVTLAVLSFLFPFRAVQKHSIRCFWRTEGKGVDREQSLLEDLPAVNDYA